MVRKLVRDRVPEIIRADGAEPVITVADAEEYRRELRAKLGEEIREYLEAGEDTAVEELADVLEVVYALATLHGASPERVEEVRRAKADERGGFADRLVWHGNRQR
ncbi:Predicted house-cleaning noncanonical NTP pyrophosphatase, all-alpha NTP-PPase (MazG) superfamily [Marinactinospora thermotolerans DSM 45154]|uniref:Predicted house-cleaning noncanonical NTP pyrophosphatase, all-alpha NTP-PPase (MazG) superfamily n=1 Tax=Marinactinospora thermotolerans DSM 45154 TaxID=1122192 RepID=A0A1T4KHZ8_9ACTN|nr:nucleoside triphosphate pyrophosphohydrolase [Marinactinospora thermotolerans]SJZ41996.1 Predicted house-cleaning noncanonical NTP pyrophosphatase, all-alpha NTP-PPase (MazG) superfamily [Marinactinospora thermotolerans DSM 45154]